MNVGTRVKHEKYGDGTIIYIMFEDTIREGYIVKFDVSDSELHNGFGLTDSTNCYFCESNELEVIE